MKTSAVPFGAI